MDGFFLSKGTQLGRTYDREHTEYKPSLYHLDNHNNHEHGATPHFYTMTIEY